MLPFVTLYVWILAYTHHMRTCNLKRLQEIALLVGFRGTFPPL